MHLLKIIWITSLFIIWGCNTSEVQQPDSVSEKVPSPEQISATPPYSLTLLEGETPLIQMETPAQSSISVMELMETLQSVPNSKLIFETETVPGIGKFISSMLGKVSGSEGGKYWMLCVNDTASHLGASDRLLRPGDQVTWHFTLPEELPCRKVGE